MLVAESALFTQPKNECRDKDEGQADDLNPDHGHEDADRGEMQGGSGANHGAGPGQEVDPGGHRNHAGQDAAVDADAFLEREQRGDGDEKDDRSGTVQMNQQRQKRGAGNDARWPVADGAK